MVNDLIGAILTFSSAQFILFAHAKRDIVGHKIVGSVQVCMKGSKTHTQ